MTELPRGTVTFLFSDIEGSTRLLTRLRAGYAEVFREHQDVLRAAFEEHDGREVHTAGDAFFVVFARASDAIAAAVAGQRALASHDWPAGVDVRVRMGLHTGEAALLHGDYFGLDVHRAARICSAGHGGQVLVSSSTYDLVANELPEGVALRALGEHRLKDLDRPERLFQTVTGDLPTDFPPLDSMGGGANGLPTPPNRTIGRDDDVRAVAERLAGADAARLLTLMGPGGVGKTRLAQEAARTVAREFTAGARFVSLAPVSRADDVPTAVLRALGVTPDAGEDPAQAVRRYLSAKHLLLVLDNFEHVLEATGLVSDLLSGCPSLAVLATSREALSLAGEQRYPVAPLALPLEQHEARALEQVPAVALFAERARAKHPGFTITAGNAAAVVEVCRRVDGLPLAIELAAARCGVLSPGDIAARLAAAPSVLGRGPRDAPARQQTLRATIDWSHRLLSPAEARAFAGFAVFAGGATITAAERVTGADLDVLDALVDKHLLQRRDGASGEARLIMLETIRAFARERLEAGEAVAGIHDRHCRHYLALAESAEPALSTAAEAEWLPRLDAEIDNVRAALGWSLRHGDATLGLRLAGLLAEFWDIRAISGEGLQWLEAALEAAGDAAPLGDRARALRGRLKLLEEQGSAYEAGEVLEQTKARADEALDLSRRAGDPAGIADALLLLCHLETAESIPQRRRRALADEALAHARRAGDEKLIAEALTDRAAAVAADEDTGELEEAIAALRKLGSVRSLALLYNKAAYVTIKAGVPERGRPLLDHAASLARELEDEMLLCSVFGNAGLTALFTGNTGDARAAFGEQLRICRQLVIPWLASEGLAGLSAVASRDGDLDRAARLLGAARASGPIGDADVLAQLEREFFAPARRRHGERRWREGQAAGAGLGFEDAITLAVDHPAVP